MCGPPYDPERANKLPPVTRAGIMTVVTGNSKENSISGLLQQFQEDLKKCHRLSEDKIDPVNFGVFLARYYELPTAAAVACSDVLYRMVLHLGSFPLQPEHLKVTLDDYMRATSLISFRGTLHTHDCTIDESISPYWIENFRRILFQTLAESSLKPLIRESSSYSSPNSRSLFNGASTSTKRGRVDDVRDVIDEIYSNGYWYGYDEPCTSMEAHEAAKAFVGPHITIEDIEIPMNDLFVFLQLLVSMSVVTESMAECETVAKSLISTFCVSDLGGISWYTFSNVLEKAMPNLAESAVNFFRCSMADVRHPRFIRRKPLGKTVILNNVLINQLSFFLPVGWYDLAFSPYKSIYSGSGEDVSFSSFCKAVLGQTSTILLVSGTVEPPMSNPSLSDSVSTLVDNDASENTMIALNESGSKVIYGAYLSGPWKEGFSSHFGSYKDMLFQLQPTHDVFHGARTGMEFAWLACDPEDEYVGGVGFGSSCPSAEHPEAPSKPGSLSLNLTSNLRCGEFIRDANGQGSWYESYEPGVSPEASQSCNVRFRVDAIEVWSLPEHKSQ